MKTQLVILPSGPIVVSDKAPEKIYTRVGLNVSKCDGKYYYRNDTEVVGEIIAGIEGLPTVESALSDEECKRIGWVDVEKLADEATKKQLIRLLGTESREEVLDDIEKRKYYFKIGFKAAQSLNEKKFTLEQMIQAIEDAQTTDEQMVYPSADEIIKYVSQPKVFDVEVEMEYGNITIMGEDGRDEFIPRGIKIINNTIKVTKIL